MKLLDFGLVRSAASGADMAPETVSDALTGRGTVLGTVQYMSPEQLTGGEADARSDIFSFGAVLYEMVARRPAFDGATHVDVIAAILGEDRPFVPAVPPGAPERLEWLIRSCLARDPDDRWQSVHDLHTEIGWLRDGLRRPDRFAARRPLGSRQLWMTTTVLCALVAAALVWRELRGNPADRPAVRAIVPVPQELQPISVGMHAGPAVLSPDGRRWLSSPRDPTAAHASS